MKSIEENFNFTKEELNLIFKQKRNSFEIIKKENSVNFVIKRPKLIKKYATYKKSKGEKPKISNGRTYLNYTEFKNYLRLLTSSED